jgi:hypothetical protein
VLAHAMRERAANTGWIARDPDAPYAAIADDSVRRICAYLCTRRMRLVSFDDADDRAQIRFWTSLHGGPGLACGLCGALLAWLLLR